MSHAQDGSLDRYSADDIADACSWEGDSESFFDALVESGFVDRTSIGHAVHDWYDYAGKLIAIREKDAERKRKSRGKKDESEGSPEDVQRTSKGSLPESIRDLDLDLNQYPNKEIQDTTTDFAVIENEFCQKHGIGQHHVKPKDIMAINELLKLNIPSNFIITTMKSIHDRELKKGSQIRTFTYYTEGIKNEWKSKTQPVRMSNKKQDKLDLLRRIAKEGDHDKSGSREIIHDHDVFVS